ncbi:fatty acid CoA ligase family protein [Streptomyces sp. HNM0663]|uniref:Fatty acid CoA ligase family protein n=1 Tax=Streptomyces chengmaiensis TaxID=3040919 RepID=A0ABT6HHZ9_9ACTN|nr:fatty acid CoA ligase family protein [Streptomyces chengmaiensis]MDH2387917.1 fatty acid CoA ligase family protein [Streptomyces chengmaiensis]
MLTSGATTPLRQDASPAELLAWHAVRTPHRTALVHPDGSRSSPDGRPGYTSVDYAAFAARVSACAAGLTRHGIGRGTRTALLVPPGADLLTLVCALLHLGAVPAVVDPGMGLGRMLDCLRRVDVEAFIGVPAAHAVRRLRPRALRSVRSTVTVGRRDGLNELVARGDRLPPAPPARLRPDEPALIAYTTGSTGPAKPVEITAGMLSGMAYGVERAHFTAELTRTLVTLPLMGVFDLAAGRTAVLPAMDMGRVGAADPAVLTDAIRRFDVNAMFASPAVLGPLSEHLAQTGVRLPSLRLAVSGGAPVSCALMGELRSALPDDARVFSTYGATEALPIALIESREALAGPAEGPAAGLGVCVGRPAPGLSVAVIEAGDAPIPHWTPELPVAAGEIGEIAVSGRAVSPRYFRSPRADAEHKIDDPVHGVRWHRTGDLGWVDGEGRIWFCGRKSQRVRTADGDLHTVRCEAVFNTHPRVRRTALVGVGPQGGQRPVLCVELMPGAGGDDWPRIEEELRALGASSPATKPVQDFLPHPGFPVDVRHNAKIRRELLAGWADERLTGKGRPTAADLALRAVPLAGWAYLVLWPLLPWEHPALTALWWADAFLSVVVHALQIPAALRAEQERATGRRPGATAALTMLFGATWWRRQGRAAQEAAG